MLPPRALTIPQAAETLGVSTKTVRRYIKAGELSASNISLGSKQARWRVSKRSLDNFLRRRSR
jgi:excisionase family DNA binding protein